MRIIGGSLGGRKLASIRGMAIRPTADRVREAVFNILGSQLREAVVLDLFAGTGALGLEALSRGARRTVFVDHAAQAITVIRKNIALCRIEDSAHVLQWDIIQNLHCLRPYQGVFNLIFIDPPYKRQMIAAALIHLTEACLASPRAVVVAEHDASETIQLPPGWHLTDQRRYGHTGISFLTYQPSNIET